MNAIDEIIRNIFLLNLSCAAGDKVIVVTDDAPFALPTNDASDRAALAKRFCGIAAELNMPCTSLVYASPGRPGCEPPIEIWKACFPSGFVDFLANSGLLQQILTKDQIDVASESLIRDWMTGKQATCKALIAISKFSISHTRFSGYLSSLNNCRVATMPGIEPNMFGTVMRADWSAIKKRSEVVAQLLSSAKFAMVQSSGGHTLRMLLEGRIGMPDTGFVPSGEIGNLPGGEAYIAPIEGSASGSIAVGPRNSPADWVLRFQEGKLVEIKGSPPFEAQLRAQIIAQPRSAILAELGIGTNESAKSTEITLEAEKILGTVHVAVGDNSGFGGTNRVDFHKDYVSFGPTLNLQLGDGTEIVVVKDGKFML